MVEQMKNSSNRTLHYLFSDGVFKINSESLLMREHPILTKNK